jgi:acyl-coenzyme A thioesterase PaaI-like protein
MVCDPRWQIQGIPCSWPGRGFIPPAMTDDFNRYQTTELPPGYNQLAWHRGFGRQIGPLFEKRENGLLTRAFRVEEYHTNGMLNAHGGMLMTFADMAWGGAVEQDEDTWWVTVRLLCDFLAGAPLGSFVEGNGVVVGVQDDVITVEGRIWVGDKTIMRGTGIFKIIPRREGAPGRGAAPAP